MVNSFLIAKRRRGGRTALHMGEVRREGGWGPVMETRQWSQSVPEERGGQVHPHFSQHKPLYMKDTSPFLPSWCKSHTELTTCFSQVPPDSISFGIFKNQDLVSTYDKVFPLALQKQSKKPISDWLRRKKTKTDECTEHLPWTTW